MDGNRTTPEGQASGPRRSHSFKEGVALFGWLWVLCAGSAAVVAGGAALLSAGRWLLGTACMVGGIAVLSVWGGPQAFEAMRQWQGEAKPDEPGR
jgi:hypothetical protein